MFKNLFKKPVKPIQPETVYFAFTGEDDIELPLLTGITKAHALGLLLWLQEDERGCDILGEWLDTPEADTYRTRTTQQLECSMFDIHVAIETQIVLAHQIAQANGKTLNDWMVEL